MERSGSVPLRLDPSCGLGLVSLLAQLLLHLYVSLASTSIVKGLLVWCCFGPDEVLSGGGLIWSRRVFWNYYLVMLFRRAFVVTAMRCAVRVLYCAVVCRRLEVGGDESNLLGWAILACRDLTWISR